MTTIKCSWFLSFDDNDGEMYSSTVSVSVEVDGDVTPTVQDFITTELFKTHPDYIEYAEETL